MKKSRIELARDIIATLRRGMNRPVAQPTHPNEARAVELVMPTSAKRANLQPRRRQLQTSHS